MNATLSLVIGILVLGLVIYRQMRVRPVRSNYRIMIILAAIGLIETAQYLKGVHDSGKIAAELAGSLVLALVFGVVRALTVRLTFRDGQWWAQGSWLTIVLWVLAVGAHLGYDFFVGGSKSDSFGNATILLYLAVTFTVQRLIVQSRADRAQVPNGTGLTPLAP